MQVRGENFAFLANLIKQAKKILILVGENPSVDSFAAALFLEDNFAALGKEARIVASGTLPEVFQGSSKKVVDKIPTRKLVISFDWKKVGVEKVSYNLEGDNFNFIITPANKKISPEEINISYRGGDEDLIFSLGIGSLGEVVEGELFSGKPIVNIDKNEKNSLFGTLNFVSSGADSISALVGLIFEKTKLETKAESGKLLVLGIKAATNNFNSVSDPATFEAAAFSTRMQQGNPEKLFEEKEEEPSAPADWLSPKVFHSRKFHN